MSLSFSCGRTSPTGPTSRPYEARDTTGSPQKRVPDRLVFFSRSSLSTQTPTCREFHFSPLCSISAEHIKFPRVCPSDNIARKIYYLLAHRVFPFLVGWRSNIEKDTFPMYIHHTHRDFVFKFSF